MFSLSFFTLPETAVSDILASVSGLFSDISPIIFLIIGIYFAFRIVYVLVYWFYPHAKTTKTGEHYRVSRQRSQDFGLNEFDDQDDDFDDDDDY